MAQQQQTVLRVQTNIPDDSIIIQSGFTTVNTGDTFNISYSGTGTNNDPYTGTTAPPGVAAVFSITINQRNGIINYDFIGDNVSFLNINGVTAVFKSSGIAAVGEVEVRMNDVVEVRLNGGGIINSLFFEEDDEIAYKSEFLDLYSDIPIKINKSFSELQDISKRNSDYSIGLQLPGSKKNNRFFESFFNVDVDTLYFNPLTRVPCSVLIDDQQYFSGYLKLNKISVLNSKVEYDVTLFSSVGDLFGKIGNALLKDLNYFDPDYGTNHEFTRRQVSNWEYNPLIFDQAPPFFYPIVHNGYEYSGDTVNLSGGTISGQTRLYTSTIVGAWNSYGAAYAAGVKRYRINSPEDGLIDNQLKPALNVLNLIKLMFKTYGYSIDSDFFNTPWFRLLYMYGYFSSDTTKFSYKTPVPQSLTIDGVNVILVETYEDFTQICLGSPNIRTDRTYTIYVVKAGTGVPCLCTTPINLVLEFAAFPCDGSGPNPYNVTVTIPANTTGTTYTWTSNQFVDCGLGSCGLEYVQNYGLNPSLSDVSESPEPLAYLPTTPNTILYYEDGDEVDFSLVIDPNIKQIDFLSSIAKKFNLVFVPNPDKPTEIKIEPYTYYIGSGNVYDWTDKISYDKGFTVEPAQNYVESELILTDQEDGDYGNKTFKDQNNRLYGQNFVYNATDFKSQTKKIDTIFSAELLRQWDTPDTAPNGGIKLPLGINYAASSASQSSGNTEKVNWQYKGVKTKPKLFYNLGNFNPFLDTLGEVFTFSGTVITNRIMVMASDGVGIGGRYTCPIVSHTMPVGNPDNNKINNDSISILFNSETPVDLGVAPFNVYTENDSYNLFYSNRINNLYNRNTRFINGYFDLKLSDIQNLRPNDVIKIKDQYFTWNKINSFNLTSPELTKVELIQFNNQINTYPTRYFKYYYCDNPSVVFKFKTDMINPSLSGTSYYWSIYYDYSIGVLANDNVSPLTGFTSSIRDTSQGDGFGYVPYTLYEVTETSYNTSGIDRQYDTLYSRYIVSNDFLRYWPTYIFGDNSLIFNLFEDCSNFTAAATAYGILTGSSTYHGPAVTPTPTPTPTVTPAPTGSTPMVGSLLITFDELVNNRGGDLYQVFVNGIIRDNHFTDAENLYSTYLNIGDIVQVLIIDNGTIGEKIDYSVTRLDYTTDDEAGDMGIKEVTPSISIFTDPNFIQITFTATTVSNAYNFEYKLDAAITPDVPPTPTPTPTPTVTPTPTPTPTPTLPEGNIVLVSDSANIDGDTSLSKDYGVTWTTVGTDVESRGALISKDGKYIAFGDNVNYTGDFAFGAYVINSSNTGTTFNNYIALNKNNYLGVVYQDEPLGNNILQTYWSDFDTSPDGKYQVITTNRGPFYYSLDSGTTFQQVNQSVKNWVKAVVPDNSPLPIYAITSTSGDTVYRLSNLSGFTAMSGTSSLTNYTDIAVSQDRKYILLGAKAEPFGVTPTNCVFLSTNSGTTFSPVYGAYSNNSTSVAMSADGKYMYHSINDGGNVALYMFRSSDSGTTFTATSLDYVNSISVSASGQYVYCTKFAGSSPGLYKSTDYGVTFTRVTSAPVANYVKQNKTYLGTEPAPGPTPSLPPTPTYGPWVVKVDWQYSWSGATPNKLFLTDFSHDFVDVVASDDIDVYFVDGNYTLSTASGTISGSTYVLYNEILTSFIRTELLTRRRICTTGGTQNLINQVFEWRKNGTLIGDRTLSTTITVDNTCYSGGVNPSSGTYSGLTINSGDTISIKLTDTFS